MTTPETEFAQAMAALGGGSPTAVAVALGDGITRQVVEYWQARGRVPFERAPLVEARCWEHGCRIDVALLCPDKTWRRVKDKRWPNPAGRPLLDLIEPTRVEA